MCKPDKKLDHPVPSRIPHCIPYQDRPSNSPQAGQSCCHAASATGTVSTSPALLAGALTFVEVLVIRAAYFHAGCIATCWICPFARTAKPYCDRIANEVHKKPMPSIRWMKKKLESSFFFVLEQQQLLPHGWFKVKQWRLVLTDLFRLTTPACWYWVM